MIYALKCFEVRIVIPKDEQFSIPTSNVESGILPQDDQNEHLTVLKRSFYAQLKSYTIFTERNLLGYNM